MTKKNLPKQIFINARFLTQSITGVQRYAHELIKALDYLIERGEIDTSRYKFELLAPRRGILHDLGLKHIPMRRVGYLSGHAWEQFELPFYSTGGLLFCPGNTAPVLSLMSGRATVVTVHSLSYLLFPEAYSPAFRTFYKMIVPLVLRRAGAVITVSLSEQEQIIKNYAPDRDRLHVIQNGAISKNFLDNIEGVSTPPEHSSHPFVLFVGSLSKAKNLQAVLQAIDILGNDEGVSLVVVGEGGKTFNKGEFNYSEKLISKVDFKGQVDDLRELIQFYRSASCLVFPSLYESSGLPPIEAMACGCPVIASSIPALMERCGDAAVYCDPQNPADIAGKIRLLINDVSLREALRQKGFERAKHFTWEKCARETFSVIADTIKQV
ncbi:MAG: glycosyltransferase family 4 protein [Firmicutes bacterium]|nr:glycosyltransferase family 4 protein [Bacillota bacterium]